MKLPVRRAVGIFFENYLGLGNSYAGKNQTKLTEELPDVYLNVDESDFSHLWVLAPTRVLELYLARAKSGDPTEVYLKIAADS